MPIEYRVKFTLNASSESRELYKKWPQSNCKK